MSVRCDQGLVTDPVRCDAPLRSQNLFEHLPRFVRGLRLAQCGQKDVVDKDVHPRALCVLHVAKNLQSPVPFVVLLVNGQEGHQHHRVGLLPRLDHLLQDFLAEVVLSCLAQGIHRGGKHVHVRLRQDPLVLLQRWVARPSVGQLVIVRHHQFPLVALPKQHKKFSVRVWVRIDPIVVHPLQELLPLLPLPAHFERLHQSGARNDVGQLPPLPCGTPSALKQEKVAVKGPKSSLPVPRLGATAQESS
mmetsp:Transcript_5084/g.15259  ORF Transcript_5084/g.15259 Transcript_5084/m.15259 type:complete len:247 (+) Transcript_5084:829-1569(+)